MKRDISHIIIDKRDTTPKRSQGQPTRDFFRNASYALQQLATVAEDNSERYKRGVPRATLLPVSDDTAYLKECATIPESNGKNAYQRSITESKNNPVPFRRISIDDGYQVEEMHEREKFNRTLMCSEPDRIGAKRFDSAEMQGIIDSYDFSSDYSWSQHRSRGHLIICEVTIKSDHRS